MGGRPRERGYRMPAEWASREGTLMAWPVRAEAWLEGLSEARDGYVEVANAVSEFEKVTMVARRRPGPNGIRPCEEARRRLSSAVEVWEFDHDDSWMRDNGPTFLLDAAGDRAAVNWRFNAWGRKYEPFDADDALAPALLERMGVPRFDAPLVMEGGSFHTDGEGTLLTTAECLLAPTRNPGLSREGIEGLLREYLGVETVVWLEKGLAGDETDGHVDNLACFAAPGVVVLQVSSDPSDWNHEGSLRNLRDLAAVRDARGRRLEVRAIEQPPARTCRGERLTLSYVNYYPVEGGLVVPVFGRDGGSDMRASDDAALGVLAELYPGRKIVPVDGMKIIKGGGNVHCITQQVPAAGRKA